MDKDRTIRRPQAAGFTLIELLVVVSIITLLVTLIAPTVAKAKVAARAAYCGASLHQIHTAFMLYLEENKGSFFPYQETSGGGTLWYWGLELPGGGDRRPIDRGKARLAKYFAQTGSARDCPAVPADAPYFKPKFDLAGYGYAINQRMLSGQSGGLKFEQITRPGETVAWADSMQVNTFQAPASPSNPMIEDWYYLDNKGATPATFHFRHRRLCNAAFADGSVRTLQPFWLDSRCDGLVGRPEPPSAPADVSPLLKLNK